ANRATQASTMSAWRDSMRVRARASRAAMQDPVLRAQPDDPGRADPPATLCGQRNWISVAVSARGLAGKRRETGVKSRGTDPARARDPSAWESVAAPGRCQEGYGVARTSNRCLSLARLHSCAAAMGWPDQTLRSPTECH